MKNKENMILAVMAVLVIGLGVLVSRQFNDMSIESENTTTMSGNFENIVTTDIDDIQSVDLENYLELINNTEDKFILYVGRSGCSYCVTFHPILAEVTEIYNLPVFYFSTDVIASQEEWDIFQDELNWFSDNEWGTPLLLIIENGEVINDSIGAMDKVNTVEFFKEDGFIDESVVVEVEDVDDGIDFETVSIEDFIVAIEEDETNLLYVARPTCSYCIKFSPTLSSIANTYSVDVNYLNTDSLVDDEFDTFYGSLDYFTEEEWGTPLLLVTKNGEVIDSLMGNQEEQTVIDFLNDNNLIEGE